MKLLIFRSGLRFSGLLPIKNENPSMKNFVVTFPDGATAKIKAQSISPDFSNGVIMLMDDALAIEAVLTIPQIRFVAEETTLGGT